MEKSSRPILLIILLTFYLAACAGAADQPASVVQAYLKALAAKDTSQISVLTCASWESQAQLELDSLQAVDAQLQGVRCATTGKSGDKSLVTCQGKLVTTYNGENQDIDLSLRTYEVIDQNGDYLVCGYQ
jgi:hypothetical protein